MPELIEALHQGLLADEQPTLLVGSGCARDAGIPTSDELIDAIAVELDKSGSPAPVSQQTTAGSDAASVLAALRSLSTIRRRRIVDPLIDVPVSSAFQGLAAVAAAGYFRVVLTTAFDTLLERALNGVGLRPSRGLDVVDMTIADDWPQERPLRTERGITVAKLRGDMSEGTVVLDGARQKAALRPFTRTIQRELARPLVVVGYEGEMPILNEWLRGTTSHQVWWVSNTAPPALLSRPITKIDGDDADPERFFGLLDYHLNRRALEQLMTGPGDYPADLPDLPLGPGDEPTEAAYLSSQLENSVNVSRNVAQWSSPGQSAEVESQLAYQRSYASRVESELASSGGTAGDWLLLVLALLEELLRQVEASPAAGDSVESYVESQLMAVKRESESDNPNEPVVTAAAAATLNLVRQLALPADAALLRSLERAVAPAQLAIDERGA